MGGDVASAEYPSVSVIVPTRDRPALLDATLAAILAQDYPGEVEVLVVFDQSEVRTALEKSEVGRAVRVIRNERLSGLAGARNTGILAARGGLVAFCDDDDRWHVGKLTHQVQALLRDPQAVLVTCGIRILYGERAVDRPLLRTKITFNDLLRSRLTELHPSTFLFRRPALLETVGLVDESIPGSYAEDYELLLRTTKVHPVVHLPQVEVDVLWHRRSYFSARWTMIAEALEWLLGRYPEFRRTSQGFGRVAGQIAFAHASRGDRRASLRWATRTLRVNPFEGRAYLALAVASGTVGPDRVLAGLHRYGKGL